MRCWLYPISESASVAGHSLPYASGKSGIAKPGVLRAHGRARINWPKIRNRRKEDQPPPACRYSSLEYRSLQVPPPTAREQGNRADQNQERLAPAPVHNPIPSFNHTTRNPPSTPCKTTPASAAIPSQRSQARGSLSQSHVSQNDRQEPDCRPCQPMRVS